MSVMQADILEGHAPGKRVYAKSVSGVRIPLTPLNVLDRNGQQTDKKLQINDLWLFYCPKVLLPRLQKYGKRGSSRKPGAYVKLGS